MDAGHVVVDKHAQQSIRRTVRLQLLYVYTKCPVGSWVYKQQPCPCRRGNSAETKLQDTGIGIVVACLRFIQNLRYRFRLVKHACQNGSGPPYIGCACSNSGYLAVCVAVIVAGSQDRIRDQILKGTQHKLVRHKSSWCDLLGAWHAYSRAGHIVNVETG